MHLKPGPELEKARREVTEYERFRGLVGQVTEVNEAICQARPAVPGEAGDIQGQLTLTSDAASSPNTAGLDGWGG